MVKKTVDESKNEFNSKLLLLHQESIIVNVEYEKAVRMSNLTTTAINCFDALEQQLMKKDTDKCCYTTHRKRWIRAIEQVLLQNRALKAKRPADTDLRPRRRRKPYPLRLLPRSPSAGDRLYSSVTGTLTVRNASASAALRRVTAMAMRRTQLSSRKAF
jgi:hypothetical protein